MAPPAAPAAERGFAFDVCVSFAGENRDYAEKVVRSLQRRGIKCFYDRDEQANLWGKDLVVHLDEVYRKKARFCVMFISEHYAVKLWTNHERQSIQARVFESNDDYLLPVRLDNTEIPGLRPTLGYVDGCRHTPSDVAALIKSKITGTPAATTRRLGTSTGNGGDTTEATRPKKTDGATKSASAAGASARGRRKVNGSGRWILLGDNFFEAVLVAKENEEIRVHIAPRSSREEAELKALESRPHWNRVGIAFAHGNDAVQCRLENVTSHSENGKVLYALTLRKEKDNGANPFEMAVQNMSADKIAEKRARLVLLDEKPATGDEYRDQHIMRSYGNNSTFEPGIVARTLKQLGGIANVENLQKARLAAVSQLIRSGIIEHVLELDLGPATAAGVAVRFEGRRHAQYNNQAPATIEVNGHLPIR